MYLKSKTRHRRRRRRINEWGKASRMCFKIPQNKIKTRNKKRKRMGMGKKSL